MSVGLMIVLVVAILCTHDLVNKYLILEIKKEENCNNKRIEKYKNNYTNNSDIKQENKQLEDTLSSKIWSE